MILGIVQKLVPRQFVMIHYHLTSQSLVVATAKNYKRQIFRSGCLTWLLYCTVHGELIFTVANFYILQWALRRIETATCNDPEAGRSVLLDEEDVLSDPTPAVATALLLNPTLSGIFFWKIDKKAR